MGKSELKKAVAELHGERLRHAQDIPLGIMVEVPSVCYIIDHFCDEVDFFSIGSNDMTQYLYAVDRNNPRVSPLYNPITPSFLRMLRQIIHTAHERGKWVGICGELGGESRYLPLLLGLGLDELSMSSPRIPAVKSQLRHLDSQACRALASQACECRSAQEIEALLNQFAPEKRYDRCWRWKISLSASRSVIRNRLSSFCAVILALTGVPNIRSNWKRTSGSVRRL